LLPWAWLHALKDYSEMLETVVETGAKVTVNLVPSLLEQLERYEKGEDQDYWLDLIKRCPADLNDNERRFCVEQFFSVNEDTQILPNRRYHELFLLRGHGQEPAVERFSDQDILDLQVLFLLAWTGSHLRRKVPLVSVLLEQKKNFREDQKQQLLFSCHDEVGRFLTFHRQLEEAGQIELSVTPYAHPILPLLCNLHIAQEPSPGLPLPPTDFRYPEDARLQVREGLKVADRVLGSRPRGMWPAEGAVSEEAVTLLADEEAVWAATDEDILARSIDGGLADRSRLYQIYSYAGLPLLFRDRELSDRIGFLYATWKSADAVDDLMQRLRGIAHQAKGGTVAIILDGENCWERYADNGYTFLRDFYQALNQADDLELVTIQQALKKSIPVPLDRLAAGSWIRSDFTTWVGHPEENLAWEYLHRVRRDIFTDQIQDALDHPDEPLSELVRQLLRAEASDWFWWYGDEHVSVQADIFDRLFRLHLEWLYHLRGEIVPDFLLQTIKPVSSKPSGYEPTACFTPTIDGRIGNYFEWLATGCIDLEVGGAMYASCRTGLEKLYYGYDSSKLYFRIDQANLVQRLGGQKGYFEIRLTAKETFWARYSLEGGKLTLSSAAEQLAIGSAACQQVLEMAIPLAPLGLHPGDIINISCHVYKAGRENGRWPTEGKARFCYRGSVLDEENWLV